MALFAINRRTRKCYAESLTKYALTVRRRPIWIYARERLSRNLDTFPQGQTRRLELVGEYDLSQRDETAALFGALSPNGPATIDMSRVDYVDSSFLHELVKLRKRLTPHRITLVVRSEAVRRILHLVKFDLLFDIVEAT